IARHAMAFCAMASLGRTVEGAWLVDGACMGEMELQGESVRRLTKGMTGGGRPLPWSARDDRGGSGRTGRFRPANAAKGSGVRVVALSSARPIADVRETCG